MNCNQCDTQTSKKIIRDQLENIPQPGFIGNNYNVTFTNKAGIMVNITTFVMTNIR